MITRVQTEVQSEASLLVGVRAWTWQQSNSWTYVFARPLFFSHLAMEETSIKSLVYHLKDKLTHLSAKDGVAHASVVLLQRALEWIILRHRQWSTSKSPFPLFHERMDQCFQVMRELEADFKRLEQSGMTASVHVIEQRLIQYRKRLVDSLVSVCRLDVFFLLP